MSEGDEVILHGFWASPYSMRVELALKIKGIPYEYVEEDLMNKSPLLLKYNPIHKKVPVLVHNGNPVAESLIILEYIDETWKNGPMLLPQDPYKRAKVRFWTDSFMREQLFEATQRVFKNEGEAQAKALEDTKDKMKLLEEGMREFFPQGTRRIDEGNLGVLDIIMSATFSARGSYEEVLGLTVLDPDRHPLIYSWVTALNEVPLVKESIPPHDKLVGLLQLLRQNALKPSSEA